MNRAARTTVPPRVISDTSMRFLTVVMSTRLPARVTTASNTLTPSPTSTVISTRSPRTASSYVGPADRSDRRSSSRRRTLRGREECDAVRTRHPQHQLTWEELAARARLAGDAGLDGVWVFGHFKALYDDPKGPSLEAWTLWAGLARETSRVRLGTRCSSGTLRNGRGAGRHVAGCRRSHLDSERAGGRQWQEVFCHILAPVAQWKRALVS